MSKKLFYIHQNHQLQWRNKSECSIKRQQQIKARLKIEHASKRANPNLVNQEQQQDTFQTSFVSKSKSQRVIIGAHLDSVNQYNPWWYDFNIMIFR